MNFTKIILCFLLSFSFLQGQEFKWKKSGSNPEGYNMGGNPSLKLSSENIGFIESKESNKNGFGTWMTKIDAKNYVEENIRLSAKLKTSDIKGSYSIWLRIDAEEEKGIRFGSTQRGSKKGNTDWETFNIVTDVPAKSNEIFFGILLKGSGKIEVSGLKLEEVNDSVPLTVMYGNNEKAGKYKKVNDIKIYYEIYGEGQPLVVLHGNGGSIENVSPHYPFFINKNYKVIAVDSRAQGRSGNSERELTYDLLASDINELLNHLGIDSVYLWGHSDGAIIGLVMALKYPEKIKKLVAFAPNIVADTTGIHPSIYKYFENTVLTTNDSTKRKLHTMFLKHPNIKFKELEKIQTEVLLISGDRDFIPLEHTVKIFNHLPKVNLCIIPGATHGAAWEKMDLFLQLATDFFEKPFKMPSTVERYK